MSSTSSSAVGPSFARRKRTILSTLTALAFALVVLPATAFADTTWTGATNTDWNTDTNWTDGQPDAADVAIINNTSANNPTVSTAGEVADAVQLSGNKQLNITAGTLVVDNQITVPAGSNVNVTGGELTFGTLQVDNASGLTLAGGAIAGTLTSTTPVTLTNAGTNYGTAASGTNGVTLGSAVDVNQTANVAVGAGHFLAIGGRTYTLSGSSITDTGSISIGGSGTLRHTGAAGSVNPTVDSSGLIESQNSSGLTIGGAFTTNSLGGTLRTTGSGAITLGGPGFETFNVKPSGLTMENTGSGTITIGGAFVEFNVNGPLTVNNAGGTVVVGGAFTNFTLSSQTVSLNGNLDCGPVFNVIAGTGTFDAVSPNFGELQINDCNLAEGANVTITADTTARIVGDTDWTNNSTFNVNGTLLLDDSSLTAPGGNTPLINISSTGTLRHIGPGTGLVEPRIVSSGTIEDASDGELRIQRTAGQTNLYSGTIRTLGINADVELGTEVHRLQGALTMDSSQGGEIRTIGDADLQLNGNTLTLVGPNALEHESGTISGTGTIGGSGTLRVEGGDFAGGGTMNVDATTIQTSATNVGGFGSQLRIGGDWTSNADMTSTETATVVVTSTGTLRHSSGTSEVSAPLTVNGTVDVDGGQLQLSNLSNYDGGTDTLTGGTYEIAGGGTSLCIPGAVNTLNATLEISDTGTLRFAPPGCASNAITDSLASIGGTFTLVNGHVADIDSPLTVDGTLAGNGTIIGDVHNSGVVSPGLGIGELDIDGAYTQDALGTLEIEVSGTGADQFDVLEVDGDVGLNGTLAMLAIGGYASTADGGDRVAFLRYTGTRSGTFADVTTSPDLAVGQPFFDDYDDPGKRVFAVVGNTFKPGGFVARRNRNNGTATLIVKVTGSGLVVLKGKEVKRRERTADGPGKVNLPVKTKKGSDARKELNRDGKTTVKVKVTFFPDIGNRSSRKLKIKLIDRD